MPNVEDYLSHADRNLEVAGRLAAAPGVSSPISLQWAVVCVFYAAVHYVNAYLESRTGHVPDNHGDRETRISMDMDEPVDEAYRDLKTVCDNARYRLIDPTGTEYQEALTDLNVVRSFVDNELRPEG